VLRFVHGLIKKVIIADPLGVLADAAFSTPDGNLTTLTAWIGVTAYTFQIYFDFSGYSDMAIGLARMLGFRFPENFNRPYSSVSVTDFWRRWHMTLSAWFRDYLYIPLGGDRVSQARTCEPADRVPGHRRLARSSLDVRPLGRLSRHLLAHRKSFRPALHR
jgi:alginate O-acetyltransferase complex protein AlgI